ncbi:hypothetical protein VXJ36_21415 [Pseudomonas nitroreducens]|uniref:hypothetical protein n=1 Tax=Pseudomonas nitroreducens TaxID=46680 RepID=UPI002F35A814
MPKTSLPLPKLIHLCSNEDLEIAAAISFLTNPNELTARLNPSNQDPANSTAENSSDSIIEFTSLDARDQLAANFYTRIIKDKNSEESKNWIKLCLKLNRESILSHRPVAGIVIGALSEEFDVLTYIAHEIEKPDHRVFDLLHLTENALPFIRRISTNGIIAICKAQHEKTKNDLAAGHFFSKLQDRLKSDTNKCQEILASTKKQICEALTSLYGAVQLSLSTSSPEKTTEELIADANSKEIILRSSAIWILGRLINLNRLPSSKYKTVEKIISTAIDEENPTIQRSAIFAATEAIKISPHLAEKTLNLLNLGNKIAAQALLDHIISNTDESVNHQFIYPWLSGLAKYQNQQLTNNLDWLTYTLLSNSRTDLATYLIEQWIENLSPSSANEFSESYSSTLSEISKNKDLQSKILTNWLLKDNQKFLNPAASLLSHLWVQKIYNFEFHTETLNSIKTEDLYYLVRKFLGITTHKEHLFSATISISKSCQPQIITNNIILELLTKEIGEDYPEYTINNIKKAIEDQPKSPLIETLKSALNILNKRSEELNTLNELPELRPSTKISSALAKLRAKDMESMQEKAQENSIIRKIATIIPIKSGKASFTIQDDQLSEPNHFHSFSNSYTLPRRFTLDSAGYELNRFLYRITQRGEE